jgi:hypothetical protein
MKESKTAAVLILSQIHVGPIREREMVSHSSQKHFDAYEKILFSEIKQKLGFNVFDVRCVIFYLDFLWGMLT